MHGVENRKNIYSYLNVSVNIVMLVPPNVFFFVLDSNHNPIKSVSDSFGLLQKLKATYPFKKSIVKTSTELSEEKRAIDKTIDNFHL